MKWWRDLVAWWKRPIRIDIPVLRPMREPREHMIVLEARRAFVLDGSAREGTLVLGGWNPNHYMWHEGDYFVIDISHGRTTRYRINKLEYGFGMFTAHCTFAPRGEP